MVARQGPGSSTRVRLLPREGDGLGASRGGRAEPRTLGGFARQKCSLAALEVQIPKSQIQVCGSTTSLRLRAKAHTCLFPCLASRSHGVPWLVDPSPRVRACLLTVRLQPPASGQGCVVSGRLLCRPR